MALRNTSGNNEAAFSAEAICPGCRSSILSKRLICCSLSAEEEANFVDLQLCSIRYGGYDQDFYSSSDFPYLITHFSILYY